jgi:hypothetical protein
MTNNFKQTSLEWLLQKIEEKNGKEFTSFYSEFIDEANQMHKEEHEKTWNVNKYSSFDEYYNKTFNK